MMANIPTTPATTFSALTTKCHRPRSRKVPYAAKQAALEAEERQHHEAEALPRRREEDLDLQAAQDVAGALDHGGRQRPAPREWLPQHVSVL